MPGRRLLESSHNAALARNDMQWDSDPLAAALDSHIFFAKEASLAGGGAAGGGCGCN